MRTSQVSRNEHCSACNVMKAVGWIGFTMMKVNRKITDKERAVLRNPALKREELRERPTEELDQHQKCAKAVMRPSGIADKLGSDVEYVIKTWVEKARQRRNASQDSLLSRAMGSETITPTVVNVGIWAMSKTS